MPYPTRKILGILAAAIMMLSISAGQPSPARAPQPRDLPAIKASGELRVLMTETPGLGGLARSLSPRHQDMSRLMEFTERLGVRLTIIYVEAFSELFPALQDGRGDIIADNITITEERLKKVAFSPPIDSAYDVVVAKNDNEMARSARDLAGKTVTIERGTSYWASGAELQQQIPSLHLASAPVGVDTEELLGKVASGSVEFAIADDSYVDAFLAYCPRVKVIHMFPQPQRIAWATRKSALELQKAINDYLATVQGQPSFNTAKGDLPAIQKRKVLRVLTRNNFYCYYLSGNEVRGFEHDLANEFARRQGLKAVMIVPPKWSDLIPWLREGKGDLIAAQATITPERTNFQGITFCKPYCEVKEIVVTRSSDNTIKNLASLAGRTFAVRHLSSYWQTLKRLRDGGLGIKLQVAPPELETTDIILKVASGQFDLTLVDSGIATTELAARSDVKAALTFDEPRRYGWITRSEDKLLRGAVNEFFDKEYKGLFYNVSYRKYYGNSKAAKTTHPDAAGGGQNGAISPFDDLIRQHAKAQHLDWLFIASQIKQESGFDPNTVNDFSCHGLMQLSKKTSTETKCADMLSPSENIRAGTAYMRKLIDRFETSLAEEDRLCFALASYNAGHGHVLDARALSAELKLDPRKWFGNVEKAMELLSTPEYASKAKYGYCRSSETLPYVRDIYFRYKDYQRLHR